MKNTKCLLALLTLFALNSFIATMASAKESSEFPMNFGLYGGLNMNLHTPGFLLGNPAENILKVPFDENSASFGMNFGIIGNFPLSDIITLSGRIGFNAMGANLEKQAPTFLSIPPSNSDNTLDASLNYLEISPLFQFHNIIPLDDVYLLGGLEFGFPIASTYTHSAKAISPATFTNGEQEITITDNADIPDAGMRFAIAIGAGYICEISDGLYLSPELSLRFPVTDVSSNVNFDSWNVPQLRFGVSLTFGAGGDKEPEFASSIDVGFESVRHYDKNNNPREVDKLTVEEVQYTELYPLIPYVFCDPDSEFPSNSGQELSAEKEYGEFTMKQLESDALEINKKTFDIIGIRMQKNKNYRIKITGTNDNDSEQDNLELSRKRAEFAKNYLVINYGINPNRIETEARNLPEKASAVSDPDGLAENRRIEFSANNQYLFEPILIKKDKQTATEPNLIEFVPYIKSTDSVTSWSMEISQADKMIRRFNGDSTPEPLKWVILPNDLVASEIPVDYHFSAENSKGLTDSKSGTLPVEFYSYVRKKQEDRPDKSISKFSLIVFDFNSPEISETDKDLLQKQIVPAIKYNSTVQIYGYTDRIGDEDYNKKLALQRANNVKEYLESKARSAKYEVFGIGENIILFDNNLPTGRQLSRTVQVYVITPKE